jgi:FliI/YscN family ATPase
MCLDHQTTRGRARDTPGVHVIRAHLVACLPTCRLPTWTPARSCPALDGLASALGDAQPLRARGRVSSLVGLGLEARVPGVRVGELVEVRRHQGEPLLAEVVGFHGPDATLMPLGRAEGVSPEDEVLALGRPLQVTCGDGLLGRVLDGLGQPIDGLGPVTGTPRSVYQRSPDPLTRPRITRSLATGVRAIDALLTLGEGQRVGLFAGSGVGKSTLLGQIARQADADVFVACLIGERGREVREFLEDALGEEGRRRGVVVCATSDAPALVRLKSAHVATAIAEHFRDQGKRVLLMMDSVTRFARAGREVGLAAGSLPRGVAIRPACSPPCPSCSSARAPASAAPSPASTRCWWREATWRSPWPTRCAASWTVTSCSTARSARVGAGRPSTC